MNPITLFLAVAAYDVLQDRRHELGRPRETTEPARIRQAPVASPGSAA